MQLEVRQQNNYAVIRVNGELDAVSAPFFDKKSAALLEEGRTHFIIDLEKLVFISSAGLRSLLTLAKAVRGEGKVVLAGLSDTVLPIFITAGFTSIFTIVASAADAPGA